MQEPRVINLRLPLVVEEDGSLVLASSGNMVRREEDGTLTGLDQPASDIILKLDLNSEIEKQIRRNSKSLSNLRSSHSPELRKPIQYFEMALTNIATLNRTPINPKNPSNNLLRTMLYANIISALESLFSDYLIISVRHFDECLKNLGANYDGFKEAKYTLKDLINADKSPRELAINKLHGVTFHNLNLVGAIYKAAFNVEFSAPEFLQTAINNRHDIVHRNGYKTGKEKPETYTKEQVFELVTQVQAFVIKLLTEIKSKNSYL